MNGSKRVYLRFTALALPWLLAGSTAIYADDDATFDRTPRDCVITQSIARTDILDDQTIIFYMRGKNVAYRNYLPKKCPGLKRWDRFSYQVTARAAVQHRPDHGAREQHRGRGVRPRLHVPARRFSSAVA